jgi:uncharacterized protein
VIPRPLISFQLGGMSALPAADSRDGAADNPGLMVLSSSQADQVAELCRRYGVHRLSLFGSAAIGSERPDSDVDLLVEFERGRAPSAFALVDLRDALSALFGRPVDLAFPSVLANPYRRRSIEPQLRPLFAAA